jgi:hypothetical protein
MKAGVRRAVASFGAVAFLGFWIWGATTLADHLPAALWIKLVYFAVAGTAWGLPLFPLIAWANKPARESK